MNGSASKALWFVFTGAVYIMAVLGIYVLKSIGHTDNIIADSVRKGNAYYSVQLYDKAVDCYLKALNYEPDNQGIVNGLVKVLLVQAKEQEDYENAVNIYEQVLELDPDNRTAYWGIADIFDKMGDYSRMSNVLEKGYENTLDGSMREKMSSLNMLKSQE